MKKYGTPEQFALWYEINQGNQSDEKSEYTYELLERTFGKLDVYVDGHNLSQFTFDGVDFSFEGYLYWPIKWLCENLFKIVGYDPFPLPVNGVNARQRHKKAIAAEIPDEVDFFLWRDALFVWYSNHGWYNERGGTILPDLVFHRIDDMIELSWDNENYLDEVKFKSMSGCVCLPHVYVRKVLLEFIRDFVDDFKELKFDNPAIKEKTIHAWEKSLERFQ